MPPWELVKQPAFWMHAAHAAMVAEHKARDTANKPKRRS